MLKKRLTIMVPAFNEEGNLEKTIEEIEKGTVSLTDFEILIFDDGSTDNTGSIAENLAKKNKKIRVFHHTKPKGMGSSYREGLKIARFENYMYIPGDNQLPSTALKALIEKIGSADIVIPYVNNMHIRPLARQKISSLFTLIINLLFGLHITYYNGTVIHKAKLLKSALPKSDGHAYQAEVLVRLLKRGATFVEVGYNMYERENGQTTAFKWRNIKSVIWAVTNLFWEINIQPLISHKTLKLV